MKTTGIQALTLSALLAASLTGNARAVVMESSAALDYPSTGTGSSSGTSTPRTTTAPTTTATPSTPQTYWPAVYSDYRVSRSVSTVYPESVYELVWAVGSAKGDITTSTTYMASDLMAQVTYINGWPVSIKFTNTSPTLSYWVSNVGGENRYNEATKTWGIEIKPGQSQTLSLGYYNMGFNGGTPAVSFNYQYYQKKVSKGAMVIKGINNTVITNFINAPTTTNGTKFTPVTQRGGTARSTFTFKHQGTGTLTLGNVRLTGINASQYRVVSQPSPSINPGSSASVVIEYAPAENGTHVASVNFTSNDMSNLTGIFGISGTATNVGKPVIELCDSNTQFATMVYLSSNVDFGRVTQLGTYADRSFAVLNSGGSPLVISGSPAIRLWGTDASQFIVAVQPSTSIPAGGTSTAFTLRYKPTASGNHKATAVITSNDPVKPSLFIDLTGSASFPASSEPTFFYYTAVGNQSNLWMRSGGGWIERMSNGGTNIFDYAGRSTLTNIYVNNAPGHIVRNRANGIEVFIPDTSWAAKAYGLWCRAGSSSAFGYIGPMSNVR